LLFGPKNPAVRWLRANPDKIRHKCSDAARIEVRGLSDSGHYGFVAVNKAGQGKPSGTKKQLPQWTSDEPYCQLGFWILVV